MGKPVVHWEFWSKDPAKVSDFNAKAAELLAKSAKNPWRTLASTLCDLCV